MLGERRPQIDEAQSGVPVVRVENRRTRSDLRERGDRGTAEKREPAVVVGVVAAFAVQLGTVVEPRMIDEDHVGAAHPTLRPHEPRHFSRRAERDRERLSHRLELP